VPTGDRAAYYPPPASCAGCHDGVREVRVAWEGPSSRVGNVSFDHASHADELAAAGDPEQACAACHVPEGGERMSVSATVQLESCWGCHAHEAADHQVDADCATCHLPLYRTRFDRVRVEALPVPADHESASFLASEHGTLVSEAADRCATCHTRERCVACHVDAGREEIVSFPGAPGSMDLPAFGAEYPVPESHGDPSWLSIHGAGAAPSTCATCHTSDDCLSCHVQPLPAAVAALPTAVSVDAPGVGMVPHAPESHGSFFFMEAHATLAAARDASCAACHRDSFCVSCHDGPVGGGYHPTDFLSRHTASAFGRDTECSNCHSTAVFCRECHVQSGLVARGGGRLGPGYHDDGPFWLLRHGQAARQNLESCASCHRQVDCTQCHGVLGAFKVSPHTSSFDAQRSWARSPRTCLACHVGNPLGGGGP